MNKINCFDGEFGFLSNFHPSIIIDNKGVSWNTAEHLFQSLKTINDDEKEMVRSSTTAGRAKRAGRKVTLRSDWEKVKVDMMMNVLFLKFKDEKLAKKLLRTGNLLIEEGNNWHDNFWGNCSCEKCLDIIGLNNLGKLLMRIRHIVRIEMNERK